MSTMNLQWMEKMANKRGHGKKKLRQKTQATTRAERRADVDLRRIPLVNRRSCSSLCSAADKRCYNSIGRIKDGLKFWQVVYNEHCKRSLAVAPTTGQYLEVSQSDAPLHTSSATIDWRQPCVFTVRYGSASYELNKVTPPIWEVEFVVTNTWHGGYSSLINLALN